jgi:hypothetical protein
MVEFFHCSTRRATRYVAPRVDLEKTTVRWETLKVRSRSGLAALLIISSLAAVVPSSASSAAHPSLEAPRTRLAPHGGLANPSVSIAPSETTLVDCNFEVPTSSQAAACDGAALADVNAARSTEGVGPMILPTNYASLSGAAQQLVVVNLERVDRGLGAVGGLSSNLDAAAMSGAQSDTDPSFPPYAEEGGSNWASTYSALLADFLYLYDDGPGGVNGDCTSTNTAGCWGHRDTILADWTSPLLMGAADLGGSSTQIFLGDDTTDTADALAWSSEATDLSILASPTTLALGSNGVAVTGTVTVWASGEEMDVTATTTAASAWSVLPGSCDLDAGSSCPLTLSFQPAAGAADDATLAVVGPNVIMDVSLTGTGPTVPSVPVVSSGTPTSGDLSITFSDSHDGGSPLTGFRWRESVNGGPWGSVGLLASSSSSLQVAGPGTATTAALEVAAVNVAGPSGWSSPVTFSSPGSVTHIAVVAGRGSMAVSWRGPTQPSGQTMTYQVVSASGASRCSTTLTRCVLTRLTWRDTYRFHVRATDAVGPGAWSAYTSARRPLR